MLVTRLSNAVNAHDIEAVVGLFSEDYVNETPVHPSRGFRGRDQVRKNWTQFFATIPDMSSTVLRATVDGEVEWSEWEMGGTRLDGSRHLMRGIVMFGIANDRIAWARFYLEPVDTGTSTIDDAVRAATERR
jgi:ketosteroid isomerase-like protein